MLLTPFEDDLAIFSRFTLSLFSTVLIFLLCISLLSVSAVVSRSFYLSLLPEFLDPVFLYLFLSLGQHVNAKRFQ